MSNEPHSSSGVHQEHDARVSVKIAVFILSATAALYLLLAAGFNEALLGRLLGGEAIDSGTRDAIRNTQLWFLILALLAGAAALSANQKPPDENPFARHRRTEWLMVFLLLFVPLSILELVGRPLVDRSLKTSLFMRDDELGWRLRPNASDVWGLVPVSINAKGVRGPELPYEREVEAFRILYLGDSVTFGYGIENDFDTYPYRVEACLEAATGVEVETINAGVGGYSPWQELIQLEREGFRYNPDLVVLGFYLNDVTEKFGLPRFGGRGGSFQLANSHASRLDRLLAHSGSWAAIRRGVAHLRLGKDLQEAASELEALNVGTLLFEPENPLVQKAWEITLGNMARIVESCRNRKTDLLLIAFPDATQIEFPELGTAPQEVLAEFAGARDLPYLDLLPSMKTAASNGEFSLPIHYRGSCHPTAEGTKFIAPLVAEFIRENHLDARVPLESGQPRRKPQG